MKKCALINDLSGFGKCSLGAQIPVISILGIEAHPMPTAVLSNQTAYKSYKKVDLTEYIEPFFDEWNKLGVSFDGILTGFFSDERQIQTVLNYVKNSRAILLVDPVMGDEGKKYHGFSDDICHKISDLSLCADIVTPNTTELYLLTGEHGIDAGAQKLLNSGIKSVVVTGIMRDCEIGNAVFEGDRKEEFFMPYIKGGFSGTGDIFSSIVLGKVLNGSDIFSAVKAATDFIYSAIKDSDPDDYNDGIDFEKFLKKLL